MSTPFREEMPRYIPPVTLGTEAVHAEPNIKYVPCVLPGPGQGFQVDPARLRSVAAKWEELARGFNNDLKLADNLINIESPAKDYASINNAVMISRSGESLKASLINREQFCASQARKYRELAEQYERFDEDSSRRLRKIGNN